MSNRYEAAGVTSAAPAIGGSFAEFRVGARRALIEQIEVSLGAATATNVALTRGSGLSAGASTTLTGIAEDPSAPAAGGALAMGTYATTQPTITPANMLKRFHLPGAIGAGIIWTWPQSDRLIVPANGSIVLFTPVIAGAAAISVGVIWTE